MKAHLRVVFTGNGYSKEWPVEATKRGLPNLSDTKGLVADAVASGLQVSVVSTQMQTRVIVEGSRRVLQTYVRAIPGRYTGEGTITWDGTATVR